jgi:hypothetical protein
MTGDTDIDGLQRDLGLIADESSTDDTLRKCATLLALPPVQAVSGDENQLLQVRALRMLLRRIGELSENINARMAARLLLSYPGLQTRGQRQEAAASIAGATMKARSVRRHKNALLNAFLHALLDFVGDPAATRIFVQEAGKSLGLGGRADDAGTPLKYYVHRDEHERRFKELVRGGAKLIAFVGQPGMGKTWLVESLMSQYEPTGSGVAWITFESNGSISIGDLYSALKRGGLPIGALDRGDPRFHLQRLLCDENGPRFVVLDNLHDIAALHDLLPREPKPIIVVTARVKTRPPGHCHIIDVGRMTDEQSRTLLHKLLPELETEEIRPLMETVQGHPQVTVYSSRLIERRRVSVQEFCDALGDAPVIVLSNVPAGATETFISVLAGIVDLLRERDEDAFRLLTCIALIGTLNKFPRRLLRRIHFTEDDSSPPVSAATKFVTYATALESLVDFCLIDELDEEYIVIHPLTRDVLRLLLVAGFGWVTHRVLAAVAASTEDYTQEVNSLVYREGDYYFEHPFFYEVAELWRMLTTVEKLADEFDDDDLARAAKLILGLIAEVTALAAMAILDQAVTKANESAPASGEELREEFRNTELYTHVVQDIPKLDEFFTNLDMTQSNAIEMLKVITGSLRVSGMMMEMSKSAKGSPQVEMITEIMSLGLDILNNPQEYINDTTNST